MPERPAGEGPIPASTLDVRELHAELHARIDRLEELLAWQLAADTLHKISIQVGDPATAQAMSDVVIANMRNLISSRT